MKEEETKKTLIIIASIMAIFIVVVFCIFLYQWKLEQNMENEKHSYDVDWDLIIKAEDEIEHIIRGYSDNATLHLDVAVQYLQLNFTIAGKEINLAYENFTILENFTLNFSRWCLAFVNNESIFSNDTLQILLNYDSSIYQIKNSCELKYQDTRRLYLGMLRAGGIEP